MAILVDYAFSSNVLFDAFHTEAADLEIVSATATRVELRNPETFAVTVLTGTGLGTTTVGGEPSVTGTLTGVEFIDPNVGFPETTFTVTGISWSAAEFVAAVRAAVEMDDFARLDALLSLQPVTYDARQALFSSADWGGVDFSFWGVTSNVTMFGSDFYDTLQGGQGNDTIDPGLSQGGDGEFVLASGGSDTIDLRGISGGSSYAVLDYGVLGGPVQITLDGVANTGRVVKTGEGTDTILGVRNVMEAWSFDVYGTVGSDTFTLRTVDTSGGFLFAAGGAGNDTFNLTLNSTIRVGYDVDIGDAVRSSGIVANLATGVVSQDGFGGQDRINILGGTAILELSASRLDDSVTGSTRAETIFLRRGNDTASGGNGNDTIYGGEGSDSILGGDGDDLILPGTNDDRDVIDTGRGLDTIDFAPDSDPAESDRNRYTVSHRSLADAAAIEVIINGTTGTGSRDSSLGEIAFVNILDALNGGTLTIEGTGLADTFDITLDQQYMEVMGGRGSDTITVAGNGWFTLFYDIDSNGVAATQGVVANLATGAVANDGFGSADTLQIGAGIEEIYLWLSNRADSITGRDLADWLIVQGGNDTLRGGAGFDTLDYGAEGATAGVRVDLGAGTARGAWGGVAFAQGATGFEGVWGTWDFGDVLIGSRAANVIEGLGGNDALYGDGFRAGFALPQAQQVYRLYQATLDRAPDTAGQIDWTARLAEGTSTLAQVAAGFVGSREFQNVYGALDNTAFVTLLYQNVLDRAPDAGGLAGWVGRLNGGTSRAEVVTGFSESREFVTKTLAAANAFTTARLEANWTDDVFRLYQATLDRAPDAAGFMDWLGRLGGGTSFLSAVEGFVGSREFQNTYGALDNTAFVTLLYQNVLDRAPDAGGLANWLAQMAGGLTRAQVVEGFAQGREFVNATAGAVRDFVRDLNFAGEGAGIGGDEIRGGTGDNRLWGGILSDEFIFDADNDGTNRVMDFETWDTLTFVDFVGYLDTADIRARMVQSGADVVFQDQGVTVTILNTQLAAITDDSLAFFG